MNLLRLEFFKCRRRHIVLVCAAVLGVELFWFGAFLIDAIILPLSVAVLASRSCELEHKGGTWKLLETMANPGKLYAAKLAWGALVLGALLVVRTDIFAAMGMALHFPGTVPWVRFGVFTLISWAVSMMVYALQQGLSLYYANQAVALVCGVAGSFLGILSMLFPPALVRFVPWGYYGLMALVRMDWNEATRVTRFFWKWPAPADLILLCVWAAAFLLAGRALFVKKEV